MKRYNGMIGIDVLECVNPLNDKWHVRYDIQPTGEDDGVTFAVEVVNHKPTLSEVKEIVLGFMNKQIDERILNGFEWNGMPVWLSTENQFNYKAAYDLAVQTQGASLPVTFKFGTKEEPVYHEFTDLESFTDFYTKAMAYINAQLAEGWVMKDAVDWTPYEEILNK